MKLHIIFVASVATILALLFALFSPRAFGISLTLLGYQRWPNGAMLLLSNSTPTTIHYLSQPGDTPGGNLVLWIQKTSDRWTNSSLVVKSITGLNPATRKMTEFFYLANPAASPKPGDHVDILQSRDLEPSQSVRFFVRLEPGEPPRKVGTVYYLPQTAFEKRLRAWLQRLQHVQDKDKRAPPARSLVFHIALRAIRAKSLACPLDDFAGRQIDTVTA